MPSTPKRAVPDGFDHAGSYWTAPNAGTRRRASAVKPAAKKAVPLCGEPWWLVDPRETDQRFVGRKRYMIGLTSHVLCWVVVLAGAVYSGRVQWNATWADVTTCTVPLWAVCVFRAVAALIGLGVICVNYLADEVLPGETLDRTTIDMRIRGKWQFQSYTVWGWCLLTLYFCVATAVSLRALLEDSPASWLTAPSHLACCASMLLGVCYGSAIQITTISNFVLIPSATALKLPTIGIFFFPRILMMHNANVVLLSTELLLADKLHIELGLAPVVAIYGLLHVAFHQTLRYDNTHTLLYFFLNWQNPWNLCVLAALHVTLASYYAIAFLITEHLRPLAYGPLVVLVGTLAMIRLRAPAAAAKSE